MGRKYNRPTLAMMLICMLLSVSASNAFAAGPPSGDSTIVTIEELQRLRGQFANGQIANAMTDGVMVNDATSIFGTSGVSASFGANPWGCKGKTFNPHKTTRNGLPAVSVHARSWCPNNFVVPFLWVETQLYKETHCIFSVCLGVQVWGPPQQASGYDKYSVEAHSDGACENGYYKGVSSHMMIGPDDKTYSAFTHKRARVTGC